MKPGLVDSHIHLTDFGPGVDIRAIVKQADAVGVTRLVCNATGAHDWARVIELAGMFPQVTPFLGLHPWFVLQQPDGWFATLEEMVRVNNCGVGEIGLDKCMRPLDRERQEEAFRIQLELARRYERPVTVHCVRSWGWLMDVLSSVKELPERMLIHSYGGSVDLIKPLARMGAYFSFSGKVLFANYERARQAITAIPPDRLLIETDAPNMLPPEEYRRIIVMSEDGSELNHPANLPAILEGIAALIEEPTEELRERLWENAERFIGDVWV
jgi:TatD DNase family protein